MSSSTISQILEILDNHLESEAAGLGEDMLIRTLREDLDTRLHCGEW